MHARAMRLRPKTHLYTILPSSEVHPRLSQILADTLQLLVFRRRMQAVHLMKEEKSLWLKYVGLRSAVRRKNSRGSWELTSFAWHPRIPTNCQVGKVSERQAALPHRISSVRLVYEWKVPDPRLACWSEIRWYFQNQCAPLFHQLCIMPNTGLGRFR